MKPGSFDDSQAPRSSISGFPPRLPRGVRHALRTSSTPGTQGLPPGPMRSRHPTATSGLRPTLAQSCLRPSTMTRGSLKQTRSPDTCPSHDLNGLLARLAAGLAEPCLACSLSLVPPASRCGRGRQARPAPVPLRRVRGPLNCFVAARGHDPGGEVTEREGPPICPPVLSMRGIGAPKLSAIRSRRLSGPSLESATKGDIRVVSDRARYVGKARIAAVQ